MGVTMGGFVIGRGGWNSLNVLYINYRLDLLNLWYLLHC